MKWNETVNLSTVTFKPNKYLPFSHHRWRRFMSLTSEWSDELNLKITWTGSGGCCGRYPGSAEDRSCGWGGRVDIGPGTKAGGGGGGGEGVDWAERGNGGGAEKSDGGGERGRGEESGKAGRGAALARLAVVNEASGAAEAGAEAVGNSTITSGNLGAPEELRVSEFFSCLLYFFVFSFKTIFSSGWSSKGYTYYETKNKNDWRCHLQIPVLYFIHTSAYEIFERH